MTATDASIIAALRAERDALQETLACISIWLRRREPVRSTHATLVDVQHTIAAGELRLREAEAERDALLRERETLRADASLKRQYELAATEEEVTLAGDILRAEAALMDALHDHALSEDDARRVAAAVNVELAGLRNQWNKAEAEVARLTAEVALRKSETDATFYNMDAVLQIERAENKRLREALEIIAANLPVSHVEVARAALSEHPAEE